MPNQKATNQFSSTFASLSKICQDILVKTSVMGKTWNISDAYSWYNMVKVNKSPVSLPKLNTHLKSIQDAEIIKLTAVKVSMSDNWYFFLLNQALESGFLTNEKSLITSRFSPVISSGYFRQEISLASLSREMIVNYSSSKSKKLLKTLNIDKKRFSDEDYMTVKTEVFNFFCFNNKLDTLMTEDSKKSCLLDELMVVLCDDIQACTADIVNKIHTWLVAKPELDNRYNDIVSNLLYYYLISGKQQEADQLLALTSDSVRDLFAIVNSLFFDKVCDLDELLQTYYKSIIHWKATATPKVINYLQVFFYLGMLIPKKNLFGSAQLLKLIPTSTQAKLSPAVLGTLKELVKRNSGEIVNSSKNFVAKIRTESITTQFLQDVGACLIHRHTADCNPEFVYDHSISSDIKVMNDLSLGIFSNEYQFLIKNTKEFLASLENVGLISRVERTPEWLFMLEGLEKVYLPHKKRDGENAVGKERLIWIIDEHSHSSGITCKKQKINNHGKWSNGTAVSAKSLRDGKHDAAANDQDFTIIQCMECSWGSNWTFNRESALLKMSGAQNLYKKVGYNDQLAIQIIEDKQTLQIQHKDDGYFLSLNHWSCYPGTKLKKESEQAYKVVRIEDKEVKLSRLIPQKGRLIPEEGKALLLELAPEMAKKVRVDSNLEEIQGASLEIEASSEITIRLYPLKGGVKVESIIGPFGKQKRTFHPGKGTARFFETSLNDEQVIFIRDLEKEKASYSELMELCPIIAAEDDGDFSCFIEGVEDALELISELYAIKDKFNTEWPEGEHLLFAGNVDMDNLQLRIKSENSWFELEGDVIVSETEKLKAKDLLMPDKRHGRFIQLSDGRFLAMTKSLHKKLEVAKSFVNVDRNAMKLHPTAAWGFNEFAESVGAEVSSEWKEKIERIQKVKNKTYQTPKLLEAELRDYQTKGFRWLSRLADLEFGACLADDMGLGKTVQALALILRRRAKGPVLVVAPASVCENWKRETNKFTPTMNPVILRDQDREQCIKKAKSGDILITTYGLMVTMQEQLLEKKWGTVVLDEAQLIKNHNTKRTKVAHDLQSGFKIITTGTPVENNLFELWSLFEFINPGMLGNKSHFFSNFVKPIQVDHNEEKNNQLKRLVKPFILRRKKIDVLEDLPSKTEISLSIELSESETAIYENIREESIEMMEDPDVKNPQFLMLAQLTKLRRACCHTALITKKAKGKSAKIAQLIELVHELKEGGHRVLVFSQFVGFLKFVEEAFKKEKISYQYLDGSTNVKKRQLLVDKFQKGKGDAFLISLKAGGTGLNLTAADYVVHLDPWWNPAAEDQASDRAHRIGQTRPVTVYRFITKNTIEERITKLHHEKRSLSESILSGTDMASKMSVQDIVNLLK